MTSQDDDAVHTNKAASSQKADVPINVIARLRPPIPSENRYPTCIEVVDDSVVDNHKTQIVVRQYYNTAKAEQKIYSFEKVLEPDST